MANSCARSPRKPLKLIQPTSASSIGSNGRGLVVKYQRPPIKKRFAAPSTTTTKLPVLREKVGFASTSPPSSPLRPVYQPQPAQSPTPPNSPNCRRVRFADTAQVILIRKRTREEKQNAWYTSSDYQQFDEDRRNTLRHFYQQQQQMQQQQQPHADNSAGQTGNDSSVIVMDTDSVPPIQPQEQSEEKVDEPSSEMTLWGLEGHLLRETAMARKRWTRQHCYSVLQQQYYNHWYGIYHDDESLRNVSLYYSSNNSNHPNHHHHHQSCTNHNHQYNNNDASHYNHNSNTNNNNMDYCCGSDYYQQQQQHHEGYLQAALQRSIFKML